MQHAILSRFRPVEWVLRMREVESFEFVLPGSNKSTKWPRALLLVLFRVPRLQEKNIGAYLSECTRLMIVCMTVLRLTSAGLREGTFALSRYSRIMRLSMRGRSSEGTTKDGTAPIGFIFRYSGSKLAAPATLCF
jgi:hypothetical protein